MRMLAFVDLDLTLFDYTAVREGATRAALNVMNVEGNIENAIELMNSVLIPYGDLLVEANLPNFRKEWKAPELFAILSLLSEPLPLNTAGNILKKFLSDVRRRPLPDQGATVTFQKRLENVFLLRQEPYATHVQETNKEILRLFHSTNYRTRIENAIIAFDEYLKVEAAPSEGSQELLGSLTARGFEVYVVSEGEERIQREKVQVLGLSNHIDGVYVSSSCCQSHLLLGWLWKQANAISAKESENQSRAFEVLYDEVLQYSNKSTSFFRKVLHTIIAVPSHRADFYRRFGWLSEADCSIQEPLHILLLGDRYDKDLFPGIEAFGNVISLRLLAGKYKNTFQSGLLKQKNLPEPTSTVCSLTEAAQFIERLPNGERLPQGKIAAMPSNSERIRIVEQAFQELSFAIDNAPRWIVNHLEGLKTALRGSEKP